MAGQCQFGEGKLTVQGGIVLTKASYAELWCLVCHYLEQAVEQTVKLPVISNAIILMWCYCNETMISMA